MVFGKLENIAFIEASVHGMGVFCTHAINYICLGCVLRSVGTRNDSNLYLRESVLYISCSPRAKLDFTLNRRQSKMRI